MIRRRLYAEIRTSKLAVWSFRLAVFVLPVLLLTVLLHRAGTIEYFAGVSLLIAVLAIALLALILAVAAIVVIWNDGLKGLGSALLGGLISAAVLGYPSFEIARGIALPAISDISTDAVSPPPFRAVAAQRPRGANPVLYSPEATAELQKQFYPAVRTVEFDAEPAEIYTAVLALVQRSGWRIAESTPPTNDRDGLVEATAATPLMGFREDVSIRIRRSGNMIRVDMRSASRFGKRDFGTNARRVEAFLALLSEARRRPR